MLFRKLNKKGDVRTIAPSELVGWVLGGVIVLFILGVIAAFATLYFSEKQQEYAVNNFVALANKIETLSNNRDQFDFQRAFPFYLPGNFVVIGFNKEWDNNQVTDGCEPEAVRKPNNMDGKEGEKCKDSSCICLFTNNDDLMDGEEYNVNLVECRQLPKVDYLIIPDLRENNHNYSKEIYKNLVGEKIVIGDYSSTGFSSYSFTYIYGQCDNYFWDTNLQSRKIYIEKLTLNGKTYIFIAPEYEQSNFINERYSVMNEKYGKLS